MIRNLAIAALVAALVASVLAVPSRPAVAQDTLGGAILGGVGGGVCLEGKDDLARHVEVFDQLRAHALSPVQTASLLRGLISS